MIIVGIVAAAVLLPPAAALVRTLGTKPTAAEVKLPEADAERSAHYAAKLSRMISTETVSYRGQTELEKYYRYQQVLRELFPRVFETCEFVDTDGSILLRWRGKTDADPIMFMSHQDVVEAKGDWSHEPFGGEISDGRVWGRGTVDTKGNAFCFFQAVEELIGEGFQPQVDVYLAGSCTEEWSGPGASKTAAWLKQHGVHLQLLMDEGGMVVEQPMPGVNGLYAMVGLMEKGYGDLKFCAKSSGGHASAPGKGTPWARLAGFVSSVEKKSPFRAELSDTMREMLKRFAPNMSFGKKYLFSNLWLFAPLVKRLLPGMSPKAAAMMRTTLAFTMGQGSEGYNVLPQEAWISGNMRFIHHQAREESIALISGLAEKHGLSTQVVYADDPCPIVSYDSGAFRLVEAAVKKIYPGVVVSPYVLTFGTDCKFYTEVCDNCLRFAPIYVDEQQVNSLHGLDENIFTASLPPAVDVFREIIKTAE